MLREYGYWAGLERVEIPMETGDRVVPRWVDGAIRDAEMRATEYEGVAGGGKFVAGDYLGVFQVLEWLKDEGMAGGGKFLEWGSGQGMVTILADAAGYEARGVEIDAWLVGEARRLAELYDSGAEFVRGSYDERLAGKETPLVTAKGMDVVYAYPWPGEEELFLRQFETTAGAGALLVLCFGTDDIRVYRRTAEGR